MGKILFTTLLFLQVFSVNIVNAQVAAKDQIFEWNNFSGGLNTKTTPFELERNQGSTVQNVRIDARNKALSKRDRTVLAFEVDAS